MDTVEEGKREKKLKWSERTGGQEKKANGRETVCQMAPAEWDALKRFNGILSDH